MSALLSDSYQKLNLTFDIDASKHVFFHCIHRDTFDLIDAQAIQKGAKCFYFNNIYEVLLWYHFFTSGHKHFERKVMGWSNKSYFSRIPPRYRNLDPKKGLNIVKEALNRILIKYNGIPPYYEAAVLEGLLRVTN